MGHVFPRYLGKTHPRAPFDVTQAVVISSTDELMALPHLIERSLIADLRVEILAARMVPVLLNDGCAAVFALQEHVGSDQADELERLLSRSGYCVATTRYVVPAPLLLAIGRGQLGPALHQQPDTSGAKQDRNALASAFRDIVEWGVRHEASDIHFNVYLEAAESEIKYTVSGRYVAPERFRHIPTSTVLDMLSVAWMEVRGGNGAVFDPLREQQGNLFVSIGASTYTLRWSSMAADAGPSVCLRILVRDDARLQGGLAGLGYLPEQLNQIERVLLSQGGAVIFAGTVGSGKSTSLAALIRKLSSYRKVLTLEDPVEYPIPGAIQNSIIRNLDETAHDIYAGKLRALKRSAMSDVLLGEVRDRETGRAFVDLAISGVNVYTTVHAPSAGLIPARLASEFIGVPADFLATPGVLKLLVYQVLLPALCLQCAQPVATLTDAGGHHPGGGWYSAARWSEWLDLVQRIYGSALDKVRIRNPEGCAVCRRGGMQELYGYHGRVLAAEIIEPALSDQVYKHAMDCAVAKALQGMVDLRDIEMRFQAFETRHLLNTRLASTSHIERQGQKNMGMRNAPSPDGAAGE